MAITFFVICGAVEVWTLMMALTRPDGKVWPWAVACVLDCIIAITLGTWIVTSV